MTVVIREFGRVAHDHVGQATVLAKGVLITDEKGQAAKIVLPTLGGVDSDPLEGGTHFVEMENQGTLPVRYAIRPKGRTTTLTATPAHRPIGVGEYILDAVYPGCIINFITS